MREQAGGPTMRAIVLDGFGDLDALTYSEIPKPLPKRGEVVIRVKGFGINHAEMHMRRGEWAEAAEVSGIECVGIVDACPGGEFPVGAKVAALMGGLGRTINGSYAEYTRVRTENVAPVESDLPWAQLAALPETYATAWTCLFRNLNLTAGQTIVIRGATSSFGQAAVKLAVQAGARVIATTRDRNRFGMLATLGVERAELEVPNLGTHIAEAKQLDAVLDLVGNSTILDSMSMLRRGGQHAWPAGSADSLQSQTSIRCCKCRAGSISASLAVSCSAHRSFRCRMFPSRTSRTKSATANWMSRPHTSSRSTRSGTRTGSWKPARQQARWWLSSTDPVESDRPS